MLKSSIASKRRRGLKQLSMMKISREIRVVLKKFLLVASILTFPVFANAQEIFSKEDAFALCKQKSSDEI